MKIQIADRIENITTITRIFVDGTRDKMSFKGKTTEEEYLNKMKQTTYFNEIKKVIVKVKENRIPQYKEYPSLISGNY